MRAEETRLALHHLVHQRPFQPFIINLENGDRLPIEHPENVAFDPTENGRTRFCVITNRLFCYSSLDSVTSIVHEDSGTTVAT